MCTGVETSLTPASVTSHSTAAECPQLPILSALTTEHLDATVMCDALIVHVSHLLAVLFLGHLQLADFPPL
jgi:hypothetical protein